MVEESFTALRVREVLKWRVGAFSTGLHGGVSVCISWEDSWSSAYLLAPSGFLDCSPTIFFMAMENALAWRPSYPASRSTNSCLVPVGIRLRLRHSFLRSWRP